MTVVSKGVLYNAWASDSVFCLACRIRSGDGESTGCTTADAHEVGNLGQRRVLPLVNGNGCKHAGDIVLDASHWPGVGVGPKAHSTEW